MNKEEELKITEYSCIFAHKSICHLANGGYDSIRCNGYSDKEICPFWASVLQKKKNLKNAEKFIEGLKK